MQCTRTFTSDSMNSYVILLSLVSAAMCAPQNYNRLSGPFEIIPIISERSSGPLNGAYNFEFETGNGIRRNEQGSPSGPNGAVVSQGGWTFTFPDGTPAQFSFVADEGGYRVESPLLPQPHPLPRHAIEQIEKARQEEASGIFYDEQGFRTGSGSRPTYN
ncbi:Cuticle Protein CPR RR Uncl [Hyalella azteca]|uniref:Cuticle Protein CPR RR Uncl n=1 Tax=Hyalella azteca TaxID=294128 RepID=A0A6A0H7N9_HYAAZ|nr:cuticle protein AMP5 [Hyalella azteca]KAA0201509.1 Cuticle Protein CPR RR Uncl [Hyalella azteca]